MTLTAPPVPDKKQRLIGSAIHMILHHGYASTTIDIICAEAGVTKGSFFHYFSSKEEICRTAMAAWSGEWERIIREARLGEIPGAFNRLDKLLDVMTACYMDETIEIGCVVGMAAQELAHVNEPMREEAKRHFDTWLTITTKLLDDAKKENPSAIFDTDSVAAMMISMVQGSMLVAKTRQDRAMIAANVEHIRTYLNILFEKN